MRDCCDGELFKTGQHPLFSCISNAIQIFLYYDDFEVANPLGSKATKHKLGMYVFCLQISFVIFHVFIAAIIYNFRWFLLGPWQLASKVPIIAKDDEFSYTVSN